jgi:zinc protease
VATGEAFDVSPKAIGARVKRLEIVPGAKIALLPKKTRGNEVNFELALRYGNEQNLKELTTATAFLGPLMLRGTKGLSDQQLKDELDRLEATLSASGSSRGVLRFSLRTKSESLPAALGLLKQVLREPSLPTEEFEIMRQERIAETEKARTDPQMLAPLALSRLRAVYPPDDVRYQPTYEEQVERLKKVTHEQVKMLHRDYLGVAQTEVAIVGEFEPASSLDVLKATLADWQPKQPYARIALPVKHVPDATKLEIDTPDKANAVYAAGLLLPLSDEDPDYPALYLGNFIFGAGALSSRLGDRVRQKEGLSYGINSGLLASPLDERATFTIQAICNPQNLAKVESTIAEELEKFIAKGVTSDEVAKAKEGLLQARQVARSNDRGLVFTFVNQLYEDRTMLHVEKLEKQIAALTADEVNAALTKHLDAKRLLVVTAADRKAAAK